MTSLTQHLLNLNPDAFKRATQTKFLEHAGNGTLSKELLQQWLAQDRLYAQAYVRFAGRVISELQLPQTADPEHINERLLGLFLDALVNVRRELKFFEDTAARYGLDIDARVEGEGVRGYKVLFEGTAEKGDMLRNMILLWGTEKVFPLPLPFPNFFTDQNNESAI
jgi:thiaminase